MFIITVWIIHWANVLLKWVILLFISCWTLLLDSKLCKMIAIIKLHILLTITLPIFSVSLKFEAYYIMDQWQWVQSKECYFMFTFIFWAFVVVFHQKSLFWSFSFLFLVKYQISEYRPIKNQNWWKEIVSGTLFSIKKTDMVINNITIVQLWSYKAIDSEVSEEAIVLLWKYFPNAP